MANKQLEAAHAGGVGNALITATPNSSLVDMNPNQDYQKLLYEPWQGKHDAAKISEAMDRHSYYTWQVRVRGVTTYSIHMLLKASNKDPEQS
ncbi:hypothetical protein ACROYT_G010811 [Oculina patagonica]